jgi:hypothetical protein
MLTELNDSGIIKGENYLPITNPTPEIRKNKPYRTPIKSVE